MYQEKRTLVRNEKFLKMLGIQPGFATDLGAVLAAALTAAGAGSGAPSLVHAAPVDASKASAIKALRLLMDTMRGAMPIVRLGSDRH